MSRRYGMFVALILVGICVQLAVYKDGFLAVSQDDSYRVLDAFLWTKDAAADSAVWLPAHRVLMGVALKFAPDLVATPRVLSGSLGILCVLFVTWMSYALHRDWLRALLTCALAVVYPARLVLAAVPLAEILFMGSIVLAMTLLARWLLSGGTLELLASSVGFALATTVRYEGWLFAGAFAVLVLVRSARERSSHRELAVRAAALLLVGGFPAFWLVTHGFASLAAASNAYARFNPADPLTLLRNNPAWQFVTLNARSMTLIGVIPLLAEMRSKRQLVEWISVPALALALLSLSAFVTQSLPSHTFWRIPATWGFLLLPFVASWIARESSATHAPRYASALLPALVVFVPSILTCIDMTRHSAMPPPTVALGRELADSLVSCDTPCNALIENESVGFVHVVVASQHPFSFVYTQPPAWEIPVPTIQLGDQSLHQALQLHEIGYIVARSDSVVSFVRHSLETTEVGRYGPWVLFAVQR